MPIEPGPPETRQPAPGPVRAGSGWLALREPADAAARSGELVVKLRDLLPAHGVLEIHDLGSGTGSMARWLAPLLDVPQHWVLHDRDEELLRVAEAAAPPLAADGSAAIVETRADDVTRLGHVDLAGAHLVTASALLDMLTGDELDRLVEACTSVGCPVLITLSVVGRVELSPADPFDGQVMEAFNAHQRRTLVTRPLLGPDAARAAIDRFVTRGLEVSSRPSPWLLGPDQAALVQEWLAGWLEAAYEQRPELRELCGDHRERRTAEAATRRLSVIVHHEDLLAYRPG